MERPSSHSKHAPYARKEGRKSIFSKMKDTMRDMLSPSFLFDRTSKGASTSKETAGAQNEPEVPSNPSIPPRMPSMEPQPSISGISRDLPYKTQGTPGTFLGNGQPRTLDFVSMNQGQDPAQSGMMIPPFQPAMFPPPISEFTSAQLPLARLSEKSDSVMAHEDTMSQRSDGSKSTSGCSSMIPQEVPQREAPAEKRKASESDNTLTASPHEQPSVKRQKLQTGGSLNTTFTRRLSDTFIHRQNQSSISNRPAFNASLFDSPLNNDSSILGTSFHESSFYPGKTKFGGRSSLSFRHNRKKVDLNQSLPSRLSVPVKAFIRAKPTVASNKEAVTSSTAKRIMEALDRMSTPLNDAKKIPLSAPRQWSGSPSLMHQTPSRSRSSGPPTQKLNISGQASISKNRQVSFAPVVQSKPAATSEPAPAPKPSMSSRQDTVVLNTDTGFGGSGKMRRDKSYHRGSASVKPAMEEEETVILPNLQTDYTLPVASMPQFNFSTPVVQQKAPASSASSSISQPPAASKSPGKPSFTFSSPINEDVPVNKPASPQKYSGFQFSSPISVDKNVTNTPVSAEKITTGFSAPASKPFSSSLSSGPATNAGFSFASPVSMESNFSVAPKPKPKMNGPTESMGGGFSPATELKKGSVMDILGGSGFSPASELKKGSVMDILGGGGFSKPSATKVDSSPVNSASTSSAPPLSALFKSTGWSCDVCLISNKADAAKCVACQTPKPGSSKDSSANKIEPPKNDLFAKFQQPTGSWSCDVCLIQNKSDASKCVACQTPKPSSTKSSAPLLTGSIQPGNWICNTCLIQNKKDDSVCGACKSAKTSSAPSSSKPADLNKSDSLFAKFKPSGGQWECEVCLVQNKSELATCVACQSPKPLKAFKHPPGDWVCDTCLVNNKEADVNCVACNYARPGPPRTQTVPSIAKSYTSSQASGFSIPKTSAISGTIGSAGGFMFTASTSADTKTTSGFDVNFTSKKDDKNSDPPSGGFKFSAPSGESASSSNGFKLDASSGSGFKFGSTSSSDSTKSNSGTGGFKFGAALSSSSSQNGTESKTENKDSNSVTPGYQFGSTGSKSDSLSSSAAASSTSGTLGGFTFGQKTANSSVKESVTATTSVPGGFSFKASDSAVSSVQSNNTTSTSLTSSIGGFNVPTVSSVSNSAAVPSSLSTGGFQFTTTKLTQSSATSATPTGTESKPAFGGFSFGQLSGGTSTSSPALDAQKQLSSLTKRGRDEDSDEPSNKKLFSFGQAPASKPASTPFQFGAAATSTSNSTTPVFGGIGQTSSASTASSGLFVFGQPSTASSSATVTKSSSSSLFAFGQQNSKPATSVASSSSGSTFVFGQTPVSSTGSVAPVFGTGNASTTTTSSTPSMFNQFGSSGSSAAPSFNFTATSTTQSSNPVPTAFGSTPSFNFGGQKTEATTSAAGSGVFAFGAQPAQATTPAFGSGSSFGSSSTPVFGSSGGSSAFSGNAPSTTPAFGATPPAFGSTNNTTPAAPAFGGVFGNNSQTPAQTPAQAVFQFGAKPTEPTQAAPTAGFNFNAAPAGLGQSSSFNFGGQSQPGGGAVNVFSATAPATGGASEPRKIKKAVRKIRR